jgi:hypothetical protein
MGLKGSKEKGKKSTKGGKDNTKAKDPETPKSKENPQAGSVPKENGKGSETSSPTKEDNAGNASNEDLHESWNDQLLFGQEENKKVSKDDFELLTVIGKGSFGKV